MAKITITFDRDVLSSGYYLDVKIDPYPDTDPAGDLEQCLVVANDDPVRIAELTDFESLETAESITWVRSNWFNTLDLGTILKVGNYLQFDTVPAEWVKAGLSVPFTTIIAEVYTSSFPYSVKVGDVLPMGYQGTGSLSIWNAPGGTKLAQSDISGSDVLATRMNPDGTSPLNALTSRARGLFSSITDAAARYRSLQAQARSLAGDSDTKEEFFTGISTEEFD